MCGQCGYECVGVRVEGWALGEGKSVVFSVRARVGVIVKVSLGVSV